RASGGRAWKGIYVQSDPTGRKRREDFRRQPACGQRECYRRCFGTYPWPEKTHVQDETSEGLPQKHRPQAGAYGCEGEGNQRLSCSAARFGGDCRILWLIRKVKAASAMVATASANGWG